MLFHLTIILFMEFTFNYQFHLYLRANHTDMCQLGFSLTVTLFRRYGSLTQASTVRLGRTSRGDMYVPMSSMLPMLNPNDIEIDGWDISNMNLAEAMTRAKVLDVNLQQQLQTHMERMRPRKSIYYPDFIASNQVILILFFIIFIIIISKIHKSADSSRIL